VRLTLCLLTWDEIEGCRQDVPRLPLDQFEEVYAIDEDPASFLINVTGCFGSPSKGLAVFAPVCLLALFSLPQACVSHRRLAWFALLTLVGLTGGFSLLRNWSDETWGPRYLHAAIAPLLLCYAAAAGDRIMRARWAAPLAAAASIGLVISSLGALFYYGSLHGAIGKAGQSTLEALQSDPVWNHYRFNARLLGIWVSRLGEPPSPYLWTPSHQWFDRRGCFDHLDCVARPERGRSCQGQQR
jgi:hypothetical protein